MIFGHANNIRFPIKKYQNYINTYTSTKEKLMSPKDMERVFKATIIDFEKQNISIDDVANIAGRLMKLLISLDGRKQFPELYNLLESTAELSFYLRSNDPKIFCAILQDVRNFAKKLQK